jgi:4-hydroxy-tetrahydrodipicolinate reductase
MKVLQLGFGAVGRENVRQLLDKRHQVVAIVDTQEVIDGIEPGDFAFGDTPPVLGSDLAACLAATRPDVILQATTFEAGNMADVVQAAAAVGADLITINGIVDTQTLQPHLHDEIDDVARKAGIRVLGVGAIPGFFSDVVPLIFTGCCSHVQSISFRRRADYSVWGPDVMKRYGFALTPEEFRKSAEAGEITLFKSLWQSAYFVARELRWPVTGQLEEKRPVISTRDRRGAHVHVQAGTVGGFSHRVTLMSDNGRRLDLEVVGHLDPAGADEEPGMALEIAGSSGMRVEIGGEVLTGAGSMTSSSARMVNSIEPLASARPGLRTTADLPLIACRA